MKNTGKKRMSARRRRRRRNRILLTILICILFAGCCTLAFFQLKKGYDLDISHSYLETSDFAQNTDAASLMTAPPFAHDLCVAPGDVEYDNLSLNGNEKGALFDVDDKKVIFGKSLYDIASESVNAKIAGMSDSARAKFQETLQRVINEGAGGLICIIL